MIYTQGTKISKNTLCSDPRLPDPENLPEPLGWNLLVRPYPVEETTKSGLILPEESVDFYSRMLNIARVVKIGPCCWSRRDHYDRNGNQFNWVDVGDVVSYPKHVGVGRKISGIYYVLLGDDEIVEKLPDPSVVNTDLFKIDLG